MASKADTSKKSNKLEIGQKRKSENNGSELDLFTSGKKMEVTFRYSTKNTKIMVHADSSDEEEEDAVASEFSRISNDEEDENADNSQEILHITDSEESFVENHSNTEQDNTQTRSPSPPPPPSQADMLRVQRQLRAKNKKARDFDTAYSRLQQTVADTVSPALTTRSRQSTEVINLDESISPLIVRNRNERKITVKVRTRSGIKRFDMKGGDKFESIIKELADNEKVSPENILLSIKNNNIVPEDTPLSKDISVADIIECIIMESSLEVDEENLIEIKVQGNNAASRKTFHVSKTKPLKSLFAEYAKFRKMARSKLKFLFDDDVLHGPETPEDLDMEDENMIDVRVVT